MTEQKAITKINAVLSGHDGNFSIRKGESEFIKIAQAEVDFIVYGKEGTITQALVSDLVKLYTNNGGDLRVTRGGISEEKFDFDYVVVRATINVHEED